MGGVVGWLACLLLWSWRAAQPASAIQLSSELEYRYQTSLAADKKVQEAEQRLQQNEDFVSLLAVMEKYDSKIQALMSKLKKNPLGKFVATYNTVHEAARRDPENPSNTADGLASFLETGDDQTTYWPCECGVADCSCQQVCETCEYTPGEDASLVSDTKIVATNKGEDFSGPFMHLQTQQLDQLHVVQMPVDDKPLIAEADSNNRFQAQNQLGGDGWGNIVEDNSFPPPPFETADNGGFVVGTRQYPDAKSVEEAMLLELESATSKADDKTKVTIKIDSSIDAPDDAALNGVNTFDCQGCKSECVCSNECMCSLPNPDKSRCDKQLLKMAVNKCEPMPVCLWTWPLTWWAAFCVALFECPSCDMNPKQGMPDWVQSLKFLCKMVCQCKSQCISESSSDFFNQG